MSATYVGHGCCRLMASQQPNTDSTAAELVVFCGSLVEASLPGQHAIFSHLITLPAVAERRDSGRKEKGWEP